MRERLLILALALFAVLQTAWAYDFSATSPSGHTLYYEIISGTTNVGVVRPGTGSTYNNYVTGNVVIPATVTYNGTTYNVTKLRYSSDGSGSVYGSFDCCSGLTSVTIPNSVTSIGDRAFFYCSGLTSVTIPNSVTSIGWSAFEDCSGLTSVTIPNSVTTIEGGAFYDCRGLTSVTIPNSVTFIGGSAFYNVRHIIYNGRATGSPWGALSVNGYIEGDFVYANNTKTSLLAYIGTSTSVTIPNSVTSIGEYAFYDCDRLTSVTIPNSVTSIGEYAFSLCSGLTTLNFNAINCGNFISYPHPFYNCHIATINIGDSVQRIPACFAYNLESLTSVTIPNSVISIGNDAFYNVRHIIYNGTATGSPWGALSVNGYIEGDFVYANNTKTSLLAYIGTSTSVTIPNSVTSIGEGAFKYCSGLTSVTIPNSVTSIGEGAFKYCSGLTSVTIPNSVTSIGSSAFYGCSGLTSVTIPNSVTTIENGTFAYCSGLTSVTIPNSVTSIGNSAFRDCSGLTSVTIGNSVTTIGNYAFQNCTGLTTLNFNAINCGNFSNSSHPFYNCPITTINIGDSVQRIPACFAYNLESLTSVTIPNSVTSIGQNAFKYCSGLTSVTIPNSVTSIGYEAFSGCSGLTSVTIPNSVTYIGEGAFKYCRGLTSVTIPNSVTYIGSSAFYDCSGLTSVTIPNSVTFIGGSAFYNVRHIIYNGTATGSPWGALSVNGFIEGDFVYANNTKTSLLAYIGTSTSVTIPNSVTSIGEGAFKYCSGLTSVTIPNSVTSIGGSAFYDCSGLTSVTIPNSVTSIGGSAFYDCSGLTSVTIPNSVTSIGERAFYNCRGLTSVTIPNSVTTIGSSAFYNVRHIIYNGTATGSPWGALLVNGYIEGDFVYANNTKTSLLAYIGTSTSVTIPNSVTSIGEGAFYYCSGLTSVTIPNSVTSIGDEAFYACSGLTSVTIPNSVTSIGEGAFKYCSGLTSVTIGNSVTSIGESAFYGCSGLTTLNFNAINCSNFTYNTSNYQYPPFYDCPISTINIGDSVQRIPAYFAYDLYLLRVVTIPASVTSIGNSAFYDCDRLTSVTIPNSVTSIGEGAFYDCDGLTSITIGNSVTSIGNSVFKYCIGLTSVTIPNSVTSIGEYAFDGCRGLTSVTIPNSVTSIGSNAFRDCAGLTSVTIGNSVTTIGNYAFQNCTGLTTLNFNAINCSHFIIYYDYTRYHTPFTNCPITTIDIGDSVQRIPNFFAYGLVSLTSVTIPNSVTAIGVYAFGDCSGLTTLNFNAINCGDFSDFSSSYHPFYNCPIATINIGDSVQRIPAYFAYNLESLTSVTIPNSVTSIGDSAFADCTGLTSVTIGNSVTSIGHHAFSGCSGLTSVTIPNSVTSIGSSAFSGCSGLTSVTIPNSITTIENGTFAYCSGLTSVTIPNSVTSIGNSAFRDCSGLTSVTIPNSVTSIGSSAFYNCSGLTSVTIPNSVTSIGGSAFYNCSGLTSVTIPNSVTSIGQNAFYNCSGLTTLNFNAINCGNFNGGSSHQFKNCPITTINIGDSVQRIPVYFAYAIDSLMAIIIPNNVTSIGNSAFNGCSNLRDVTSLAVTPPTLGTTVFSAAGILKVPCGSLSAYRYSDWLDYFTIMEEICDNMTITVTSANESMGTVSGSGEYAFGTLATITATPNEGYRFVSWNDGNTNNPRTITVTGNATYIATFEEGEEVIRYTITVLSANESMGTVSGGGEYEVGTEITITAIPNEGYHFATWNDGNTDNPRTITVTEDATYIATFEEGVGIESRDMLSELAFYPNPTSGIITFNRSDIMKVEVLDAMGRTVEVYENAYTIDISRLAKGYYAMRVTTAEGVAIRKVVRK